MSPENNLKYRKLDILTFLLKLEALQIDLLNKYKLDVEFNI